MIDFTKEMLFFSYPKGVFYALKQLSRNIKKTFLLFLLFQCKILATIYHLWMQVYLRAAVAQQFFSHCAMGTSGYFIKDYYAVVYSYQFLEDKIFILIF